MDKVTYFPQIGGVQLAILLLIWLLSGIFGGPIAYVIVPLFVFFMANRGMYLPVFLGFLFILILASSRVDSLAFAENLRPIYLVLLFGIIFLSTFLRPLDNMWKAFLPFFLVAFFWLLVSNIPVTGFLKTVSYLLMLFVIPTYVNRIYDNYSDEALKYLIYFGAFILSAGLIFWIMRSDFVFLSGRYRGFFGNPNGMGIFSFLFFVLMVVVFTHRPVLFENKTKVMLCGVVLVSLILSGSRNSMAATLVFIFFRYFYKISKPIGVILLIVLVISYQYLMLYLADIITALNLQSFARLESLQDLSGRLVAFEFAWNYIKNNIWMGGGMGFSEELYAANAQLLSSLGHQGGTHNTYLSIWLDTGIVGLILFLFAWLANFWRASMHSYLAYPILLAIMFSAFFESWLSASLNAYTIVLIIILSLLTNSKFTQNSQ